MAFLWICVICLFISYWQERPVEPPETKKVKRQSRYQRGYVKARYECLKAQYEVYGYNFCALCKKTVLDIALNGRFVVFTSDHIEPWSWEKNPTVTANELQCVCADCNTGKGNTDDNDYR